MVDLATPHSQSGERVDASLDGGMSANPMRTPLLCRVTWEYAMSRSKQIPVAVADGERLLAAVGLTESEEAAYLALLTRPGATAGEVADLAGTTPRLAGHLLAVLERRGMANRTPESDARFIPTPPESAIEMLIAERQRELHLARCHAKRLAERVRTAGP